MDIGRDLGSCIDCRDWVVRVPRGGLPRRCGLCKKAAQRARDRRYRTVGAKRRKTIEATQRWRARNPEHLREWRRQRRIERYAALAVIKLERGCADCGYREHAVALDFDHVHDDKAFNISSQIHRSWESVLAEVAKCEVVCANCHRVRSQKRRDALNIGEETEIIEVEPSKVPDFVPDQMPSAPPREPAPPAPVPERREPVPA